DHFVGQSDLRDLVGTFRPGFRVLQNESQFFEDRNTKKVRFKEGHSEAKVDLVRNLELSPNMSWKDKFLGVGSTILARNIWNLAMEVTEIRLSRLLVFMYKMRILKAIGSMVDNVAKFDFKIDSRTRGRFARMAVFINLDRPLVSQLCPLVVLDPFSESGKELTIVNPRKVKIGVGGAVGMTYGPWMMVERKS
ncbi:hypothetical protein Golob_002369, partial [Gossypium lobatum]|nr:hypothetical protein [Gossypium lobatum]